MRVAIVVACVYLMVSAGQAEAQYKSIDEMKIEKIGMDTSLKDFLKMYPKAELMEKDNDEEYGVKTYVLVDPSGESFSAFSFLDNKLQLMFVQWTKKGLSDEGGREPIIKKIVLKYGKGEYRDESTAKNGKREVLVWATPENVMSIHLDDKGLMVGNASIRMTKRLNELKANKAKSKIDD